MPQGVERFVQLGRRGALQRAIDGVPRAAAHRIACVWMSAINASTLIEPPVKVVLVADPGCTVTVRTTTTYRMRDNASTNGSLGR